MPQPPIFGLTNSNSAFGATPSPTQQADQMEDSMSKDPAHDHMEIKFWHFFHTWADP